MEKPSLLNNWIQFNEQHYRKWNQLILLLLSISFTVTDWMLGLFTFTELLLMVIGMCLVISGNYRIKLSQVKWILLVLGIISLNILLNYFNNEAFILKVGVAGLIKVTFYTIMVTGLYNYLKKYMLEEKLLKMINLIAIIVCIIGLYITIALYSDRLLPYEFFWQFTRTDILSYAFNENENLIRTRSVFSEPSYLGYYLNIILGMNLFNKLEIKIPVAVNLFLAIMVILTFSYSSIAVLVVIHIMHLLDFKKIKQFKWSKGLWLYAVALVAIVILFRDLIYETLIQRTIDIFNGQDFSAIFRIVRSWDYVNREHLFMGNGMGHTPAIWNIYAYILSDLGLVAFIFSCLFSIYLLLKNLKMAVLFIVLNFQKGGYLSSAFWIFLLLIFIYMGQEKIRPSWKKNLVFNNRNK